MATAHHESLWQDPKIWVAISFVIFLVGFFRFAVPPIVRMLDQRGRKIADDLVAAEALRREAELLLSSYQQKQAEAIAEAEAVLKHAEDEASRMKTQAAADMKTAIERRIAQAEDKIARAEAQAVAEIRERIITLATEAARDTLSRELQSGSDPATDAAIANAGRLVH